MKVVTVLLSLGLVFVVTYVVTAEILLFPPLPENKCGGPQANGLTSVVHGFADAFPTYEFLGIFLEAVSDDEEVAKVVATLMTVEFNRLVFKVREIDEWIELTDFICDDLKFNINFYLSVFGELITIIPVDVNASKSTNRNRPGITGLIQEIIEILPLDEWKVNFDELLILTFKEP